MRFVKALFLKSEIMGKVKFDTFKKKHSWVRLMTNDEVKAMAREVWDALKNNSPIPDDVRYANIMANLGSYKNYKKFDKAYGKIKNLIEQPNKYFYKPISSDLPLRRTYKQQDDIIVGGSGKTPSKGIIMIGKKLENKKSLDKLVSDPDVIEPIIQTREEAVKAKKDAEEKERKERKKIMNEAKSKAAQEIVDNFEKKHNEESVEKQIRNTVTKIAKNKELMNLSKEQLRDYLRDAYEISDENALNNMMNAVVAKRAELLANKQLKQEELTEIDISKLQEQSQRDFEKKLQDQNLRYILPAQIEKRERLVQNRLNPELLKSGY